MSAERTFAHAWGPTIDELVEVARAAGLINATRRTIRGMVELALVSRPRRVRGSWRYRNVAIGQVDATSRFRRRRIDPSLIRLAVFVETGTGSAQQAIEVALEFLNAWQTSIAEERARLRTDPTAVRQEAARAARMRGNAPLPHRVRMRLGERELAMLYAFSHMFGAPLSEKEDEQGAYQLERIFGLRSGRGGATRDVSELMVAADKWFTDPRALAEALEVASAARIELARRAVEFAVLWIPALWPKFMAKRGPSAVPILDIVESWANEVNPTLYAALLATFAHNGLSRATEPEIHDLLAEFSPSAAVLDLLAEQPSADLKPIAQRLRPYQRLRLLGAARASATNTVSRRGRMASRQSGPTRGPRTTPIG
jgi:hypothetical protein